MPTNTVTIITNGADPVYDVTVSASEAEVTGTPNQSKGVAFMVQNQGNVQSTVTFGNDQYVGCTKHGTGLYGKVGTTPFTSGSQLAAGATLEVGTAVKLPNAGVGEQVVGSVSADIDHTQA